MSIQVTDFCPFLDCQFSFFYSSCQFIFLPLMVKCMRAQVDGPCQCISSQMSVIFFFFLSSVYALKCQAFCPSFDCNLVSIGHARLFILQLMIKERYCLSMSNRERLCRFLFVESLSIPQSFPLPVSWCLSVCLFLFLSVNLHLSVCVCLSIFIL